KPATQIWLWGQGRAPTVSSFAREYGPRGAIVSAVDLVRGTGGLIGWDRRHAPGGAGDLRTGYAGQGRTGSAARVGHGLGGGPRGPRPGVRPRRGPGRGQPRGPGGRKGQGPGTDRRAHRRPAPAGAAEARRLADPGLARSPHAASDPGARLRGGAARSRGDRD